MIDAVSDADLVRLARAGDAAGFGVLLHRHEARMLATAYAILGYGPDAQDAVQEAFEDGVRYRLTNLVASSDVSVWETEFVNPPDKPLHCPPAGVWLHFLDAGRTQRFRLLHVPQPRFRCAPDDSRHREEEGMP